MQKNDSTGKALKARTPVFMVGIDGADWQLVQRLMSAGKLPTLAQLKQRGCYGILDSPADAYAGGVWPDFYTGQSVAHHGIYHNKLWRQEQVRCEVPTEHWLSSRPFYEVLSEQGYRVCALDMPMVLGSPRTLNGINLGGWGTHDLIAKGSSPPDLWRQLQSRYGKPVMPVECFGRQNVNSLLLLRDHLIRSTEQMAVIAVDLLGSESWDFACVVLGAAHRAGHYLWDDSQLEKASSVERKKISSALEAVYMACDRALAQILSVAPANALKVVFAVHGMKPNHGWGDLGNDLLEEIFRNSQQQKAKRGLLYEVRRRLPFSLTRLLLTRLPQAVTDRLVQLWSANMYDWQTTPYFPLPMDQAGYIRINLRGREKNGIVERGEKYEQLCDELERYLLSLQDVDSGRAIVTNVIRAWLEAPEDASARDVLPDLVVVWADSSTQQCRRIVSDLLSDFNIEVPVFNLSGRSGNHVGRGWFVAQVDSMGDRLSKRGHIEGYSIRDLAPAVFDVMGAMPLTHFKTQPSLWRV
jgi:predicted AlkP superfamily phosphohydrolase/phosphomutase